MKLEYIIFLVTKGWKNIYFLAKKSWKNICFCPKRLKNSFLVSVVTLTKDQTNKHFKLKLMFFNSVNYKSVSRQLQNNFVKVSMVITIKNGLYMYVCVCIYIYIYIYMYCKTILTSMRIGFNMIIKCLTLLLV